MPGEHPLHDAVIKRYRHLNFFQHECVLEVRTPRVKLPDGAVRLVTPPFAGQMPFAALARISGISAHQVMAICKRYVTLALESANFSSVTALAIDMSPAFIKGCADSLPNACFTFDKFHVVGHANAAVDKMRRIEQRQDAVHEGRRRPRAQARLEGTVAWAQTRTANGFLEALNGLFQAAKRRARGFQRFDTIKTVIFLIAGRLNFTKLNPHAGKPS
jgi:transposase